MSHPRPADRCLVFAVFLCLLAQPLSGRSGEDWSQFRGPRVDAAVDGAGLFSHPQGFGLKMAWKRPLGSGYSGVSVAGRSAVTMYAEDETEWMVAFDRDTGDRLWRFEAGPRYRGKDGSFDGPIATPLLADGLAIGLTAFGRLFAVELESGRLRWSTDLVREHGAIAPHYGFASSPVLAGDTVVVEIGAKDAAVAGFDPATGARRWVLGSDSINHQTVVPFELEGRAQLLAAGDEKLLGIDPAAGRLLWSYEHGGGGPRGSMSLVPLPAGPGRVFLAHKDDASAGIALKSEGESVMVTQLWEDRSLRNSYAPAVYHDGHVYGLSSRFLTCVDAATGKARWRSRAPGDGFPILVDGHLVVLTKDGSLHVAAATPEGYEEKARVQLFDDLAWTPPGFGGGSFFVRSLSEIARVDVEAGLRIVALDGDDFDLQGETDFDRFLLQLADAEDKQALIERFMASQETFPVVEDYRVHFIYRGPGTDLAIAGDMIGSRQEAPMQRVEGSDFFYYSTELDPAARINYLFLRDFEEIVDPLNPRRSRSTYMGRDMEFSMTGETIEMSELAMPGWEAPDFLRELPAGSEGGKLESRELDSTVLERKLSLQVYLPRGYSDGDQRYPVALVHGGPLALTRGDYRRAFDNLIASGRVRPLIAVFLPPNMSMDPRPYARMWREELVPFIDARYRTDPRPEARASIGSGMSGYDAFFGAFSGQPTVGAIAAQSMIMLDTQVDMLQPLIPEPQGRDVRIYLDWSRYDFRNHQENWDMSRLTAALPLFSGSGATNPPAAKFRMARAGPATAIARTGYWKRSFPATRRVDVSPPTAPAELRSGPPDRPPATPRPGCPPGLRS